VAHSPLARLEDGVRRIGRRVPEFPVDEALTLRLIALLHRGLSARLDARLAGSGLGEPELRTLMVLYSRHGEETTPSDLCASLAQSPAGVTRLTDQLTQLGLLTRQADVHDRRRQLLQLTAAGEAEVAQRLPGMSAFIRTLFTGMPDVQRLQLQAHLRQLCQTLEALPPLDAALGRAS
jgi:MarR family transcriptional repressor of emrRAB